MLLVLVDTTKIHDSKNDSEEADGGRDGGHPVDKQLSTDQHCLQTCRAEAGNSDRRASKVWENSPGGERLNMGRIRHGRIVCDLCSHVGMN